MKIYSHTPQKNIKKLRSITAISLFGALAIMICTSIFQNIPFRWAVQIIGLVILTFAIFVLSRYIMKSFVYDIVQNDDEMFFTVTEIQNRHTITVCRLSLSCIQDVQVCDDADKKNTLKSQIKADKRKTYNYCADFLETKSLYIFSDEGEDICVTVSYDETLLDILSKNQ